jgi:hypothetical protein
MAGLAGSEELLLLHWCAVAASAILCVIVLAAARGEMAPLSRVTILFYNKIFVQQIVHCSKFLQQKN